MWLSCQPKGKEGEKDERHPETSIPGILTTQGLKTEGEGTGIAVLKLSKKQNHGGWMAHEPQTRKGQLTSKPWYPHTKGPQRPRCLPHLPLISSHWPKPSRSQKVQSTGHIASHSPEQDGNVCKVDCEGERRRG